MRVSPLHAYNTSVRTKQQSFRRSFQKHTAYKMHFIVGTGNYLSRNAETKDIISTFSFQGEIGRGGVVVEDLVNLFV